MKKIGDRIIYINPAGEEKNALVAGIYPTMEEHYLDVIFLSPEGETRKVFSVPKDGEVNHWREVAPELTIETKNYTDGSSATGVAPLPDHSPEGAPEGSPSAADLDATVARADADAKAKEYMESDGA